MLHIVLLHDRKYIHVQYIRQSAEIKKYEFNRDSVFQSVCLSVQVTYPSISSESLDFFLFEKMALLSPN